MIYTKLLIHVLLFFFSLKGGLLTLVSHLRVGILVIIRSVDTRVGKNVHDGEEKGSILALWSSTFSNLDKEE